MRTKSLPGSDDYFLDFQESPELELLRRRVSSLTTVNTMRLPAGTRSSDGAKR